MSGKSECNTTLNVSVPIIWLLGGPGCGKGTQCAKIVEKYKFIHLSSGELLRQEVASGSQRGKEMADVMKQGKLVSSRIVLNLLEKAIRERLNGARGFLIDGFPREKDDGVAFEQRIAHTDLIIFFDCQDATLVSRVMARAGRASKEKRDDDNDETLKTRIALFRSNINDILSHYADKTLVINAERPADEIFNEVTCVLDDLLRKKSCCGCK